MTSPVDTIKSAVLGSPISATRKPSRSGVVQAFQEMNTKLEAAQAGAIVKSDLAALTALTSAPLSVMAWVTSDAVEANNGIYENTGTIVAPIFVRRTSIPQFFITATNAGVGTVDAIQATPDRAIPTENGRALIGVNILGDNTTGVTISFDAGVTNLEVLTSSGNPIAIGGLKTGMYIQGFKSDTTFRLTTDIATAAIQNACEVAQLAAEAAALEALTIIGLNTFDTLAAAVASNPATAPTRIKLYGYAALGDAPPINYVRVLSDPGHVASFQIAEGSFYEAVTVLLDSRQTGVHTNSSDAAVAIQEFLEAGVALSAETTIATGQVYLCPTGSIEIPSRTNLRMHGAIIERTVDILPGIPLFNAFQKNNISIKGGKCIYSAATTDITITNNTTMFFDQCTDIHLETNLVEGKFYIGHYFRDCLRVTNEKPHIKGVINRSHYVAAITFTEDVHITDGVFDGYELGTTTPLTNHICNTNAFGTGQGRNVTFTRCSSKNASVAPTGEGFAFSERIEKQKATDCHAINCPTGFLIQEANGQINQRVQINNCSAETCVNGILLIGAFYALISDNLFIGCDTSIRYTSGGSSILSNNVFENGIDGITIEGTVSGLNVSGNLAAIMSGTGFQSVATAQIINFLGNQAIACATSYDWNAINGNFTDNLG